MPQSESLNWLHQPDHTHEQLARGASSSALALQAAAEALERSDPDRLTDGDRQALHAAGESLKEAAAEMHRHQHSLLQASQLVEERLSTAETE